MKKITLLLISCIIVSSCGIESLEQDSPVEIQLEERGADQFHEQGWALFAAHNVDNPCTEEIVHFPDGEFHFNIHGTITPSGNVSFHGHFNFNLIGEGLTSGETYHCIFSQNHNENTSTGVEINIQVTQNLISNGGSSNLLYSFTLQIIVNANGDVTVARMDESLDCT